ncbi:MAG: hypothetical protein NBV67_02425 [Tagaea sp.]|nr:hypothetical protein [Tagaea sp.]
MIALALDLGSTTGWALARPGRSVLFGVVTLAGDRAHEGARFQAFRNFLAATKATHDRAREPIEHIVFERVMGLRWANAAAGEVQIGFKATLLAWAYHHRIPVASFNPVTLKKRFAGDARADKAAMILRARALGHEVRSEHEADAVGLLYAAGVLKP